MAISLSTNITALDMGEYTDQCDGQTYKTVEIGKQTWMAENLNYKTANSWCYDNDEANCAVYGRLYTLVVGIYKKQIVVL